MNHEVLAGLSAAFVIGAALVMLEAAYWLQRGKKTAARFIQLDEQRLAYEHLQELTCDTMKQLGVVGVIILASGIGLLAFFAF